MSERLILVGSLIGYQFSKKRLGKRTVKRTVREIGIIQNRRYGIARWKGLDWLCVHFCDDEWTAIEAMQSIQHEKHTHIYLIHNERHHETGKLISVWFYNADSGTIGCMPNPPVAL